ncbi:MAG: hypothetical protein OEU97_06260, partial [Dehalococcoidia bacterium]|nr:hypothetical protein [Dehalococcoidia bacterium]MDH4299848.1 hypothetical protein [Dehalococcoidia bacterium]MDH4366692.1 hypothetical protein [Dehalococcoidia bacterium]
MKIEPNSRIRHYVARVGIFLITSAFICGMLGCGADGGNNPPPASQNLEISTWYDLNEVRNNLAGNHTLMNDLDSSSPGYDELASPAANSGKGWQPLLTEDKSFVGTFDGQGYEIRDLFINRPDENEVGLFGVVDEYWGSTKCYGVIKNVGVVNATVTGFDNVGGLVGASVGTVSNCYSTGNVTGRHMVGGLAGTTGTSVSNCYSAGNVTGTDKVGGLVGENIYGGIVDRSYSTCSVTGNVTAYTYVGGLVGYNWEASVTNSFWDIESSGQPHSGGGTGKNTTEMQDITTFSGAGWNIIAVALNETNPAYIWNIVNNVTYPFLSWQS